MWTQILVSYANFKFCDFLTITLLPHFHLFLDPADVPSPAHSPKMHFCSGVCCRAKCAARAFVLKTPEHRNSLDKVRQILENLYYKYVCGTYADAAFRRYLLGVVRAAILGWQKVLCLTHGRNTLVGLNVRMERMRERVRMCARLVEAGGREGGMSVSTWSGRVYNSSHGLSILRARGNARGVGKRIFFAQMHAAAAASGFIAQSATRLRRDPSWLSKSWHTYVCLCHRGYTCFKTKNGKGCESSTIGPFLALGATGSLQQRRRRMMFSGR